MTEQRTPDSLSTQQENELLCEKLLEWKRLVYTTKVMWEHPPTGVSDTPSFTTWADAGLILEALDRVEALGVEVGNAVGCWYCEIDLEVKREPTGPLAVRSAALEYIRSGNDE